MSTFSYEWDFMMGFGKLKLFMKFEVARFSRCVNIEGNPKIFWSSPYPRPPALFPLGVILLWVLANPSCIANLRSLASAVAEILKGKPLISGSSPSPLFF